MQAPLNISENFVVSADGTRIFAGAVGNPSNPALVFVHGFTLCGDVFNDIFANSDYSKDFYLVSHAAFALNAFNDFSLSDLGTLRPSWSWKDS